MCLASKREAARVEEIAQPDLPVGTLALCCLIASVCSLDRVVMSIAILPMGAELGYSDATKGAIAAAFLVKF